MLVGVNEADVIVGAAGAVVGSGKIYDVGAVGIAALHGAVVHVGCATHIVGQIIHLITPDDGVVYIRATIVIHTAVIVCGSIVGNNAVVHVAITEIRSCIRPCLVAGDDSVVYLAIRRIDATSVVAAVAIYFAVGNDSIGADVDTAAINIGGVPVGSQILITIALHHAVVEDSIVIVCISDVDSDTVGGV